MIAVQFSGGKDSLACVYLYRDDPDAIVLYADTGAAFPHMREFVFRTVDNLGMKLHVVSPETPCHEWQEEVGYPADIVPVDASPLMQPWTKNRYPATVIPYPVCCYRNLWEPIMRGVAELGADIVVRGSKSCDARVGVPDGHIENGVVYKSPLWDWSDKDVFDYLDKVKAEIPPQYAIGADSLDCWSCTAYMDKHGVGRFEYLRDHYPELYVKAKARLDAVRETLDKAMNENTLEA